MQFSIQILLALLPFLVYAVPILPQRKFSPCLPLNSISLFAKNKLTTHSNPRVYSCSSRCMLEFGSGGLLNIRWGIYANTKEKIGAKSGFTIIASKEVGLEDICEVEVSIDSKYISVSIDASLE